MQHKNEQSNARMASNKPDFGWHEKILIINAPGQLVHRCLAVIEQSIIGSKALNQETRRKVLSAWMSTQVSFKMVIMVSNWPYFRILSCVQFVKPFSSLTLCGWRGWCPGIQLISLHWGEGQNNAMCLGHIFPLGLGLSVHCFVSEQYSVLSRFSLGQTSIHTAPWDASEGSTLLGPWLRLLYNDGKPFSPRRGRQTTWTLRFDIFAVFTAQ